MTERASLRSLRLRLAKGIRQRFAASVVACLAVLVLIVAPHAAAAPPGLPVPRLLHICDCPAAMAGEERSELLAALARRGYVQGRNIDVATHDFAVAGSDSYSAFIARETARTRPALIIVSGVRVARGAKEAKVDTPVLFWRVTDPVAAGLVASLAHPEGNFTGFSRAIEKLTVKRLELVHEMLPQARRLAFVFIQDNEGHRRQAAEVQTAARALALQVSEYPLPARQWTPERLDALFAGMRQDGVQGFLLPDINIQPQVLVALAAKYKLPTIYSLTHNVTEWGGLAAYSTAPWQDLNELAGYADRILRGTAPKDLPVQEPARFELILNEKAARELGLTFSPVLLLRATQVLSK